VADHLQFSNGNIQWNISFTRCRIERWIWYHHSFIFCILLGFNKEEMIKYVGFPLRGKSLT
jgi:hypothetical protein